MLAAQYNAFSSDPSAFELKTVPIPVAQAGCAVVKVMAAAINPVDYKVMCGHLNAQWKCTLPFTIGYDFAGVITALPEGDMSGYHVGDAVFGVNWGQHRHDEPGQPVAGTFAEYAMIPLSRLSKKPADISFEQAAAVALVGSTASQILFEGAKVGPGSRILILGGASAVGMVACQLAKARGAWVATTASTRNVALVRTLGPDLIINYQETAWDTGAGLTDLDAVIDTVGEAKAFEKCLAQKVVKSTGSFVTIANFEVGFDPAGHPPLSFAAFFCLHNSPSVQDALAGMLAQKELQLPIEEVHPFTHAGITRMMERMRDGKSVGKHVVKIASS